MNKAMLWLWERLRKRFIKQTLEDINRFPIKLKPLKPEFPVLESYQPGDLVEVTTQYSYEYDLDKHYTHIRVLWQQTQYGFFVDMCSEPTDLKRGRIFIGDRELKVFLFQIRPVNED